MNDKKLYRTEGPFAMIAGVCGGIADYFGIDPTLVRVAWVILACTWTVGIWAYLLCAIVMPKHSRIY